MARLPFNPDRVMTPPVIPPKRGAAARADKPMSVAQAAGLIKDALATSLPGKIKVAGEISNFSERAHWFFSLKDDAACLRLRRSTRALETSKR